MHNLLHPSSESVSDLSTVTIIFLVGELFPNPALILGVLIVSDKSHCCAENDENISTIHCPKCSGDWES